MAKKDYYEVLGVSKNATDQEIKSSFRKLSRKYHPDMQAGKTDSEKKESEDKFKEIAEAYDVLSNKVKFFLRNIMFLSKFFINLWVFL